MLELEHVCLLSCCAYTQVRAGRAVTHEETNNAPSWSCAFRWKRACYPSCDIFTCCSALGDGASPAAVLPLLLSTEAPAVPGLAAAPPAAAVASAPPAAPSITTSDGCRSGFISRRPRRYSRPASCSLMGPSEQPRGHGSRPRHDCNGDETPSLGGI